MLIALLAACGKDSPGAPRVNGPVTLAIQAGDAQEAAPGAAVGSAPVVRATDASGQPASGVTISFAIDSGSGAVATAQATTGPDGTASPGAWTLGPREGANVLRATASGSNAVRFRASAAFPTIPLVTNVAVPRNGGLITVSRPGNAYNGLTLFVPDSALDAAAEFSIATKSIAPPTLPAGFAQVGPALVVTTSLALATRPMIMTIPVSVQSPDTALSVFYLDPASGVMEVVPVTARTATSLTIYARHFTSDRLLGRSAASPRVAAKGSTAALRTAAAGFSPALLIVVSAPASVLNAAARSGFQPGRDDWEYTNWGSILAAGGICNGMSISAMYNYYAMRDAGPLFGRYNRVPAGGAYRTFANNAGIRLASVIQRDADQRHWTAWNRVVDGYAVVTAVPKARLYYQTLVMALRVTGMPQLVGFTGDSLGHAVVAFASQNGVVSFADPNYPGTTRTMTFAGDAFTPFPFQASAGAGAKTVRIVDVIGASAMIDDAALAALWAQVPDESIGRSQFPKAYLQRFDHITSEYVSLDTSQSVTVTSEKLFTVRAKCPNPVRCDYTWLPDSLIDIQIISDGGALVASAVGDPATVELKRGVQRLGIIEWALVDAAGDSAWSRFRWLTVNYQPVILEPVMPQIRVDSTLRFTVTAADLATPVARYTWTFGEGGAAVNTTVPTTSHKYTRAGSFKAKVELYSSSNALLGRDSTTVTVGTLPLVGWALRTATVQNSTLPPGGIGPERSDTIAFNFATRVITQMTGTPANTAIFVAGVAVAGAGCDGGAILQQAPTGSLPSDSLVSGHFVGLLGSCGDPDWTGSLVMGPLGNGTIVGSAAAVPNPDVIVVPGGSINATMNARVLSGTFVWNVRYSTGLGTYTVAFTAEQVRPR